jgi:hypothetical protein
MKLIRRLRDRLTYANVIASLALFIALGGAAVAAGVAKNSVGTKQLKANAVTAAKIKNGAVNSHKLAHGAVVAGKLGANSIASGVLQNESVLAAKLAKNSVTNAAIANGVVGTNKLGNGVVTTVKLADGSVTAGKLGPEVAPLLGTLKSGQTLRGMFDLGGQSEIARTGVTFQFPLLNTPAAPETNVLAADKPTTACPGVSGGNSATPQAAAGQLCVYVTGTSAKYKSLAFDAGSVSRLGFGLKAEFEEPGDRFVQGQWAVTAP